MISGIYLIKNMINGKVYVGKSKNIEKRMASHKSDRKRGTENIHLFRAIQKYGESAFENFILEECGEEILMEREKYWIEKYNSLDRNFGYNILPAEMSAPTFFGRKHSDETKKKMSESATGRLGSWNGRKHTEEEKLKISIGNRGRKQSEKAKNLARERMLGNKYFEGRKHTEKTKQLIRIKKLGKKNGALKESTKIKISKAHLGRKNKNSSSKYHGVHFHRATGKWAASVKYYPNKVKHLGIFSKEEEAAEKADKFVLENNLPNPLNFPKDK